MCNSLTPREVEMSLIPIQDRNWPEEVGSVTGGEERRGEEHL